MARRARVKAWPGSKDRTWQEWKDDIWTQVNDLSVSIHPLTGLPYRNGICGLSALEQYMQRSKAEQRCIECGEPGVAEQRSQIIASVDTYWFCQECADYWAERATSEQPKRRRKKAS